MNGGNVEAEIRENVIKKGTHLAANVLEVSAQDISFKNGIFLVDGTDRKIDLFELAAIGERDGASLSTYNVWERQAMTFPNGAHAVELEVDSETGKVRLHRYLVVDDYGVIVNPLLVRGQVHGAIANGIGQALLEQVKFDPQTGQPLTGSFMDYAVPRADNFPLFKTAFDSTICTTNPLGVKGCGEAGTIAAPSAVANAIVDALKKFGVTHVDGPATPEKIWNLIKFT